MSVRSNDAGERIGIVMLENNVKLLAGISFTGKIKKRGV